MLPSPQNWGPDIPSSEEEPALLVRKLSPQEKLPDDQGEQDIMSSKGHKMNRLGYKLLVCLQEPYPIPTDSKPLCKKTGFHAKWSPYHIVLSLEPLCRFFLRMLLCMLYMHKSWGLWSFTLRGSRQVSAGETKKFVSNRLGLGPESLPALVGGGGCLVENCLALLSKYPQRMRYLQTSISSLENTQMENVLHQVRAWALFSFFIWK